MKRTCRKCGLASDDLSLFVKAKRSKHGRDTLCRKCGVARTIASGCGVEKRQKRLEMLIGLKEQPCADCRRRYPHYVMEFDHARGEKSFCVSGGGLSVSFNKLLAEIAKCDVVCANCHKARTYFRRELL